MNENKQVRYFSLGSFLGLILCLFLSVIVVFSMVNVMNLQEYDAYASALTFVFINLVVITFVVAYGRAIILSLSFPFYIQIVFATVVYSLFQFVQMMLTVSNAKSSGYILYHLCILFIYFLIVASIALMGIHNKKIN